MDLELEVHSLEQALVLRFVEEGRRQRKIVQLNGLSEHSDTASIARLVLSQCKPLIPADRLSELERLIFYLQKRNIPDRGPTDSSDDIEMLAKWEDLEHYMELLYEEGEPKQRGVAMLAELVRHVDALRLAQIVDNKQMMEALTRVWREDSRKNFELAIHLARLFHRISLFAPFHPTLSHLKIGLLSIQMVDFELGRWATWREQMREMGERERRKWEYAMRKQDQLIAVALRILLNLADDLRAEHKMVRKGLLPMLFKSLDHLSSPQLLTVVVTFLWKLSQFAESQQQIVNTVAAIDRLVSLLAPLPKNAMPEDGIGTAPVHPLSSPDFLCALFSLLFNCSFDPSSRRCLVSAGLVSLLAPHISENEIALALMYQLSIVDDAKAMVAFTDCIPVLLHLLLSSSDGSSEGSEQRAQHSLLVKSLLVNIVLEKRNAQLLCGSEGQGLDSLMAFALENEDGDIMAMKVARNIVSHEGPTRDMFMKWVPQLLENAMDKILPPAVPSTDADHTYHKATTSLASVFGLECLSICAQLPNANWTQLEDSHQIIAFLARILVKNEEKDVENQSMDENLDRRKGGEDEKRRLFVATEMDKDNDQRTRMVSDEVLLQALQLCATLAAHSLQMAERVVAYLLSPIVSTLRECQEDDEIVLQCVFLFLSLLGHGGEMAQRICAIGEEKKEQMHQQENSHHHSHRKKRDNRRRKGGAGGERAAVVIPRLLLNLMHHRNLQVRALCEQALERVAKVNAHWRECVREARFRWHNAQWLDMVQTSTEAMHRPQSAIIDNLTTMLISSDNLGDNTPLHTANREDKLMAADGGLVVNSEQLLNGTEF